MTWSVVQGASGSAFSTSVAATFSTANLSSGNKIVAVVASSFSNAPTSVQDGSSNALTLLGSKATSTGSCWLYAMDVPAGDAGTKPTITATLSGSNGQSIVILEVSGLAAGSTTAMLDGTPGTLSGSTQNPGSPTYSSSASGEFLVCVYGNGNASVTVTAPDGTWTVDPHSLATQSHATIEYKSSTGGAETGGFSTTGTGGWADLMVAFKLAAQPAPATTPPPLIPPHPQFTDMILGEAYQRADWQAQGVADLTVSFASTSGGVDTYNTLSPWNGGGSTPASQQMRVLRPTAAANPSYPHAFLIMLPVDAGQGTSFGDSIAAAQAANANDNWNLTVVQPGYQGALSGSVGPWFADNPLDPTISQEKFTLLITAWIRKNLAVTGTEKVYLIGFSRSGLAAQFLQFRHPYLFSAVASWDSPFSMTDYDGSDPNGHVGGGPDAIFGTSANFTTNYELTAAHLGFWQATGQYAVNRIWIGQGPDFADTAQYDTALTAAGIPHTYTFSNTGETHAWHTDWVAAALASIVPSSYAQAATVLPQQVPRPMLTQLLEIAAWRTPVAAPPPVTLVTASAALSGSGTLTAAAAVQFTSGAALTGTGALTAAALVTQPGAAALSGLGALTATAAAGFAEAAALSGIGTLAAAVLVTAPGGAALSGTGTLLAAASVTVPAAAALGGQGTLAAAAAVSSPTSAALSGTGSLSAGAVLALTVSASLSGTGVITVTAQVITPASEPSVAWSVQPAALRWEAAPLASRWLAIPSAFRWRITVATFPPIAAVSIECVNVLWNSALDGTTVDPTGQTSGQPELPVSFAFPQTSGNYGEPAEPVTWYPGSWLQGGTGRGYVAQALVGPGGVVTLTAGLTFDVWSKVTGSPESPAKFAGTLSVY